MKIKDVPAPYICAVTAILFALLGTTQAFADGTETLGPPSIQIASGSGIVAAGVGLQIQQPADIVFDIPQNVDVKQVLLYWEGQMDANIPGDDTIRVNGNSVTGTLIGGPAFFWLS